MSIRLPIDDVGRACPSSSRHKLADALKLRRAVSRLRQKPLAKVVVAGKHPVRSSLIEYILECLVGLVRS